MIQYIPEMDSLLWARKCQQAFDSVDDLRHFIADQRTRFSNFIGKDRLYHSHDVILERLAERDLLTGWRNYCSVSIEGNIIGYCGE